jgi:hypothetical protein
MRVSLSIDKVLGSKNAAFVVSILFKSAEVFFFSDALCDTFFVCRVIPRITELCVRRDN